MELPSSKLWENRARNVLLNVQRSKLSPLLNFQHHNERYLFAIFLHYGTFLRFTLAYLPSKRIIFICLQALYSDD